MATDNIYGVISRFLILFEVCLGKFRQLFTNKENPSHVHHFTFQNGSRKYIRHMICTLHSGLQKARLTSHHLPIIILIYAQRQPFYYGLFMCLILCLFITHFVVMIVSINIFVNIFIYSVVYLQTCLCLFIDLSVSIYSIWSLYIYRSVGVYMSASLFTVQSRSIYYLVSVCLSLCQCFQ